MILRAGVAVLVLSGLLPCARAGTIDALYAFGDSLSDVGNLFNLSGNTTPGPPYVNGQFSNGPVWLQTLASGLGLAPVTASRLGGTDYAYGGAESGTTPFHAGTAIDLTGATGQVAQFKATHPVADPNALYTIWIGANDLADVPAGSTPAQVSADIGAIVGNVDTAIGTLAASGAKNFLVVTVPDLGKTPRAVAAGPAAQAGASALSSAFDTTLVNGGGPLPSLAAIAAANGLNIGVLNTFTFLDGVVANPAAFGFTNVTSPCVTGAINFVGGTACSASLAAQNQFLFWDQIHPTTAGHALVGAAALAVVTPEPASVSMMAGGLIALFLLKRRFQRARGI